MPGMDGFEVLTHLRDDFTTASVPVTVVTSQILVPEQYQALTHARGILLKHELSPDVWQRVFNEAGLGSLERAASETIKPT
jgi:CheY-like chemotaxis protein